MQNGDTPLNLAADKGHVDVVSLLLQYGADKNFQNLVILGEV